MCVRVYVGTWVCTRMWKRPEITLTVIPQVSSTLFAESGYRLGLELTMLGRSTGQQAPRTCLSCPPPPPGTRIAVE